jgi:GDPmannose 4,6-dehydratase
MGYIGLELEWKGKGTDEKGVVRSVDGKWKDNIRTGSTLVEIDPRYYRPTEVDALQADASKARKTLGWEPKVTFEELVQVMMDYDLMAAGIAAPGKGISAVNARGFAWTKHEFSKHERIKE